MLYKINDNVIYRREMDNVLMLSPKTKKLFIFRKDVAESIDYNNNTINCNNDKIINVLKREEIIYGE